jgi:hypothetical protein
MVLVVALALSACDSDKNAGLVSVIAQGTEGMDTSTNFTNDDCRDSGAFTICATPAEYRLTVSEVRLVICGSDSQSLCSLNDDGSAFEGDSETIASITDTRPMTVISTSSYGSISTGNLARVTFGGLYVYITAIEAVLPETDAIEDDYQGATVKTCLIDECETGAQRGDVLVKLQGESSFKWFNTANGQLVTSRATGTPMTDATIAAGESGSMGTYTDSALVVPVTRGEFDTLSRRDTQKVYLRVNAEKSFNCNDSDANDGCNPSILEAFGPKLPASYTFRVSKY